MILFRIGHAAQIIERIFSIVPSINIDPEIEDFEGEGQMVRANEFPKSKIRHQPTRNNRANRQRGRLGTKFHVVQFVNTLKSTAKSGPDPFGRLTTVNNAARENERIFVREYRAIPFGKRLIFNSRFKSRPDQVFKRNS